VIYDLLVLGAAGLLCRTLIMQQGPLFALILAPEAGRIRVRYFRFEKYPARPSNLTTFYGL